jgi:hypothetical protein
MQFLKDFAAGSNPTIAGHTKLQLCKTSNINAPVVGLATGKILQCQYADTYTQLLKKCKLFLQMCVPTYASGNFVPL